MTAFLVKRCFQSLFVIIAVTLLVSWAVRLTGDPALMLVQGAGNVTAEDLNQIRESLGLNRPFLVQYWDFLSGMVVGDFGQSFLGGAAVSGLIATALQATLWLAFCSIVFSLLISIPLGIHAAVHEGSWSDQCIRVFSLTGLSFPNFWLAMMLVLVFAIIFPIFPPSGMTGISSVVLPAFTMAVILSATTIRLVRTSMLEILNSQYITVVRSKGLKERVVLYKHALRNCSIPVITFIGLQFGSLVANIVVVELVFDWPGLGTLAYEAISNRNYPVVQAAITVLALLIVAANLVADIAYGLADPRIRIR